MSTEDVLSRATCAARNAVERAPFDAESGRTRLLAAAMERRRRRRTARLVGPALLGVLLCSTAWAAATGRLESVRLFPSRSTAPASAPHRASAHTATPVSVAAPRPALLEPPPPAPSTPNATIEAPAPIAALARSARVDAATVPPPRVHAATNAPSPTRAHAVVDAAEADSLYAAAHYAHFVARDPAAAVRAWDAYLAAAPSGRFAPEAHYNRAISLARLGRLVEARAALQPFAAGAYGAYRRSEATRLLDLLAHRATP